MSMTDVAIAFWLGSVCYLLYYVMRNKMNEKMKRNVGIVIVAGSVFAGLAHQNLKQYEYIAHCTKGNMEMESTLYMMGMTFVCLTLCSLVYLIHMMMKQEYNKMTKGV